MPDNIEKCVANYSNELFVYAYYRVSNREQALDLVQDTFLSAVEANDQFKKQSSMKTWLFSILNNKIIDFYRKKYTKTTHKEKLVFNEKGHWANPSDESLPTPEQLLQNKELGEIIQQCISLLPSKHAAVFKLKHLKQEKTERICKELSISTSNYWTMMHRARILLQQCIQNKYQR